MKELVENMIKLTCSSKLRSCVGYKLLEVRSDPCCEPNGNEMCHKLHSKSLEKSKCRSFKCNEIKNKFSVKMK